MKDIKLDLSRHCIETEIKKQYNKKISQYFKTDSNKKALEAEIEILKKWCRDIEKLISDQSLHSSDALPGDRQKR